MVSYQQAYYCKPMVSATNKRKIDMKKPRRWKIKNRLTLYHFALFSAKTNPTTGCDNEDVLVTAKSKQILKKTQSNPKIKQKKNKVDLALFKSNRIHLRKYLVVV